MITQIKIITGETVGWIKNMRIALGGFECDEMFLESSEISFNENEVSNNASNLEHIDTKFD